MNKDKDNNNQSNINSEKDSFFSRWSKKKSGIVPEENEILEENYSNKNDLSLIHI